MEAPPSRMPSPLATRSARRCVRTLARNSGWRSALPFRRVRADEFLVDVGAPAGTGRQQQIAVLDDRRLGDDLVLPFHVVDIDLHDLEVRDRGAEMGADQ